MSTKGGGVVSPPRSSKLASFLFFTSTFNEPFS